jgi:hypothetical protein
MKRTVIAGLILTVSFLALGCSSSTDSELTQGDPADEKWTQAQPQIDAAIGQAVSSMAMTMDWAHNPPDQPLTLAQRGRTAYSADAAVDTFSYSYDPVTGWHEAYGVYSDQEISATMLDSVQFRDAASQIQQYFDQEMTDFIHAKAQLSAATIGTGPEQMDFSSAVDMTLSGLTGELVTANGHVEVDMSMSVQGELQSMDMDVTFTHDVNEVTFVRTLEPGDPVCPISGSMRLAGNIQMEMVEGDNVTTYNESWFVSVRFIDGQTMDVSARSGNTVWTYSGSITCWGNDLPL